MKKFACVAFICVALSEICFHVTSSPVPKNSEINETETNFRQLAYNLFDLSLLQDFGEARGASASCPLGVSYTLADINAKVHNVSSNGFEGLFGISNEKISLEYSKLLAKLNQSQFSTKNVLYVRNENNSVNLPLEASKQLQIELVHTDYISDWNNSRNLINDMIANQTGGKLDGELIAKGGWYGRTFYPFTEGAFINTNHRKLAWHKSWAAVGEKTFSDGLSIPYYQVEGQFFAHEDKKYWAVLIPIEKGDTDISAIFILPKGNLTQLTKEDFAPFFNKNGENSVKWEKTSRPVQIPAFNITLLSQHFRTLQKLGLNETFCLPDGKRDPIIGAEEAGGDEQYIAKRPYFANPIAQATHIEISPEFLQVASATGVSITSMEKLLEFRKANNTDKNTGESFRSTIALSKPDDKIISGVVKPSNNVPDKSRQKRIVKRGITAKASSSTTTTTEKTTDKYSVLIFNKPFIWLVHDSHLGILYYGSVNSLAQYKKEREPQKSLEWVPDAEKSVVWKCPQLTLELAR